MTQVSAGTGDRTQTASRPRDFKSECGIRSDNDLAPDAPYSGGLRYTVVYHSMARAATPGVTPVYSPARRVGGMR